MNTEALFSALAVVGTASVETLNFLLDTNLNERTLDTLRAHPSVSKHNGLLCLAPEMISAQLKALEQTNFLHYRHLHERAVQWSAVQLRRGDTSVEPLFATIFNRLVECLLNQDPHHLGALLDSVRDLPLVAQTDHLRTLFEGIHLNNLERYRDAEALLDHLLATPDLELEVRGRALNVRAYGLFWQGRLQAALDGYYASLAIWQQLDNPRRAGLVKLNIGIAAYELHDYVTAERILLEAEMLFQQIQAISWLASVQNELGLVYRDQGRWEAALACFQHYMAQRQAEGAENQVGIALNNIGEVFLLQGQLAKAEEAFLQALEKLTTQNVRIDTLIHLGLLHQMQNRLTEAERLYVEALETAQRIDRRDIWPTIHYRLGDLYQRSQEPERALAHLQTGIALIEATRTPLRDEGMKISLLGRWKQIYELVVLLSIRQGAAGDTLTWVERARARAFLDMLGATDATANIGVEEPLTATEIQRQLPADTALIEFFATGLPGTYRALLANLPPENQSLRNHLLPPEHLLALIVTQTEIEVVDLPFSMHQLQAQHFNRSNGRLRGTTPAPGQPLPTMTRWRDLGAQLLLPLQPYLLGKRHLYIIPHDALHYLPLHAFVALDTLTKVDGASVSYGPSASILFKQKRTPTPHRDALRSLAVGVDGAGLSQAEAEAEWIARWLQGTALLGAAATPATVCTALAQQDVIHFSCHGRFHQRQPMASGLVLAGGELSAAELLHQVRLHAEIVTLSACDTGLNQLAPGDELMGLTRALLGCGARSLLVSLWPVHEIPTRLFMEHFYQSWRQGASKAAAVVAAQRYIAGITVETLQERLAVYGLAPDVVNPTLRLFQAMLPGPHPFAHPYYWAPFILIGDPN